MTWFEMIQVFCVFVLVTTFALFTVATVYDCIQAIRRTASEETEELDIPEGR